MKRRSFLARLAAAVGLGFLGKPALEAKPDPLSGTRIFHPTLGEGVIFSGTPRDQTGTEFVKYHSDGFTLYWWNSEFLEW